MSTTSIDTPPIPIPNTTQPIAHHPAVSINSADVEALKQLASSIGLTPQNLADVAVLLLHIRTLLLAPIPEPSDEDLP